MKNFMTLLFLFAFISGLSSQIESEEIEINSSYVLAQNYYGTIGTIGIGFGASANFEKHILNKKKLKLGPKLSLGGVGFGDYDGGGSGGIFFSPSMSFLLGNEKAKRAVFFEMNAGFLIANIHDSDIDDYPYTFLGVRIVKPNHLIMRFGVGTPELIQFSIGKNF